MEAGPYYETGGGVFKIGMTIDFQLSESNFLLVPKNGPFFNFVNNAILEKHHDLT